MSGPLRRSSFSDTTSTTTTSKVQKDIDHFKEQYLLALAGNPPVSHSVHLRRDSFSSSNTSRRGSFSSAGTRRDSFSSTSSQEDSSSFLSASSGSLDPSAINRPFSPPQPSQHVPFLSLAARRDSLSRAGFADRLDAPSPPKRHDHKHVESEEERAKIKEEYLNSLGLTQRPFRPKGLPQLKSRVSTFESLVAEKASQTTSKKPRPPPPPVPPKPRRIKAQFSSSHETSLLFNETTINQSASSSNEPSTSSAETNFLSNENTISSNEIAFLTTETTISSNETTVSSNKTTVSSSEATLSSNKTTVSSNESTVSSNETTLSSSETTHSSAETSLSSIETTLPSNDVTLSSTHFTTMGILDPVRQLIGSESSALTQVPVNPKDNPHENIASEETATSSSCNTDFDKVSSEMCVPCASILSKDDAKLPSTDITVPSFVGTAGEADPSKSNTEPTSIFSPRAARRFSVPLTGVLHVGFTTPDDDSIEEERTAFPNSELSLPPLQENAFQVASNSVRKSNKVKPIPLPKPKLPLTADSIAGRVSKRKDAFVRSVSMESKDNDTSHHKPVVTQKLVGRGLSELKDQGSSLINKAYTDKERELIREAMRKRTGGAKNVAAKVGEETGSKPKPDRSPGKLKFSVNQIVSKFEVKPEEPTLQMLQRTNVRKSTTNKIYREQQQNTETQYSAGRASSCRAGSLKALRAFVSIDHVDSAMDPRRNTSYATANQRQSTTTALSVKETGEWPRASSPSKQSVRRASLPLDRDIGTRFIEANFVPCTTTVVQIVQNDAMNTEADNEKRKKGDTEHGSMPTCSFDTPCQVSEQKSDRSRSNLFQSKQSNFETLSFHEADKTSLVPIDECDKSRSSIIIGSEIAPAFVKYGEEKEHEVKTNDFCSDLEAVWQDKQTLVSKPDMHKTSLHEDPQGYFRNSNENTFTGEIADNNNIARSRSNDITHVEKHGSDVNECANLPKQLSLSNVKLTDSQRLEIQESMDSNAFSRLSVEKNVSSLSEQWSSVFDPHDVRDAESILGNPETSKLINDEVVTGESSSSKKDQQCGTQREVFSQTSESCLPNELLIEAYNLCVFDESNQDGKTSAEVSQGDICWTPGSINEAHQLPGESVHRNVGTFSFAPVDRQQDACLQPYVPICRTNEEDSNKRSVHSISKKYEFENATTEIQSETSFSAAGSVQGGNDADKSLIVSPGRLNHRVCDERTDLSYHTSGILSKHREKLSTVSSKGEKHELKFPCSKIEDTCLILHEHNILHVNTDEKDQNSQDQMKSVRTKYKNVDHHEKTQIGVYSNVVIDEKCNVCTSEIEKNKYGFEDVFKTTEVSEKLESYVGGSGIKKYELRFPKKNVLTASLQEEVVSQSQDTDDNKLNEEKILEKINSFESQCISHENLTDFLSTTPVEVSEMKTEATSDMGSSLSSVDYSGDMFSEVSESNPIWESPECKEDNTTALTSDPGVSKRSESLSIEENIESNDSGCDSFTEYTSTSSVTTYLGAEKRKTRLCRQFAEAEIDADSIDSVSKEQELIYSGVKTLSLNEARQNLSDYSCKPIEAIILGASAKVEKTDLKLHEGQSSDVVSFTSDQVKTHDNKSVFEDTTTLPGALKVETRVSTVNSFTGIDTHADNDELTAESRSPSGKEDRLIEEESILREKQSVNSFTAQSELDYDKSVLDVCTNTQQLFVTASDTLNDLIEEKDRKGEIFTTSSAENSQTDVCLVSQAFSRDSVECTDEIIQEPYFIIKLDADTEATDDSYGDRDSGTQPAVTQDMNEIMPNDDMLLECSDGREQIDAIQYNNSLSAGVVEKKNLNMETSSESKFVPLLEFMTSSNSVKSYNAGHECEIEMKELKSRDNINETSNLESTTNECKIVTGSCVMSDILKKDSVSIGIYAGNEEERFKEGQLESNVSKPVGTLSDADLFVSEIPCDMSAASSIFTQTDEQRIFDQNFGFQEKSSCLSAEKEYQSSKELEPPSVGAGTQKESRSIGTEKEENIACDQDEHIYKEDISRGLQMHQQSVVTEDQRGSVIDTTEKKGNAHCVYTNKQPNVVEEDDRRDQKMNDESNKEGMEDKGKKICPYLNMQLDGAQEDGYQDSKVDESVVGTVENIGNSFQNSNMDLQGDVSYEEEGRDKTVSGENNEDVMDEKEINSEARSSRQAVTEEEEYGDEKIEVEMTVIEQQHCPDHNENLGALEENEHREHKLDIEKVMEDILSQISQDLQENKAPEAVCNEEEKRPNDCLNDRIHLALTKELDIMDNFGSFHSEYSGSQDSFHSAFEETDPFLLRGSSGLGQEGLDAQEELSGLRCDHDNNSTCLDKHGDYPDFLMSFGANSGKTLGFDFSDTSQVWHKGFGTELESDSEESSIVEVEGLGSMSDLDSIDEDNQDLYEDCLSDSSLMRDSPTFMTDGRDLEIEDLTSTLVADEHGQPSVKIGEPLCSEELKQHEDLLEPKFSDINEGNVDFTNENKAEIHANLDTVKDSQSFDDNTSSECTLQKREREEKKYGGSFEIEERVEVSEHIVESIERQSDVESENVHELTSILVTSASGEPWSSKKHVTFYFSNDDDDEGDLGPSGKIPQREDSAEDSESRETRFKLRSEFQTDKENNQTIPFTESLETNVVSQTDLRFSLDNDPKLAVASTEPSSDLFDYDEDLRNGNYISKLHSKTALTFREVFLPPREAYVGFSEVLAKEKYLLQESSKQTQTDPSYFTHDDEENRISQNINEYDVEEEEEEEYPEYDDDDASNIIRDGVHYDDIRDSRLAMYYGTDGGGASHGYSILGLGALPTISEESLDGLAESAEMWENHCEKRSLSQSSSEACHTTPSSTLINSDTAAMKGLLKSSSESSQTTPNSASMSCDVALSSGSSSYVNDVDSVNANISVDGAGGGNGDSTREDGVSERKESTGDEDDSCESMDEDSLEEDEKADPTKCNKDSTQESTAATASQNDSPPLSASTFDLSDSTHTIQHHEPYVNKSSCADTDSSDLSKSATVDSSIHEPVIDIKREPVDSPSPDDSLQKPCSSKDCVSDEDVKPDLNFLKSEKSPKVRFAKRTLPLGKKGREAEDIISPSSSKEKGAKKFTFFSDFTNDSDRQPPSHLDLADSIASRKFGNSNAFGGMAEMSDEDSYSESSSSGMHRIASAGTFQEEEEEVQTTHRVMHDPYRMLERSQSDASLLRKDLDLMCEEGEVHLQAAESSSSHNISECNRVYLDLSRAEAFEKVELGEAAGSMMRTSSGRLLEPIPQDEELKTGDLSYVYATHRSFSAESSSSVEDLSTFGTKTKSKDGGGKSKSSSRQESSSTTTTMCSKSNLKSSFQIYSNSLKQKVRQLQMGSLPEQLNALTELNVLMEQAWSMPIYGKDLAYELCDILRTEGALDIIVSNLAASNRDLMKVSARLLEQSLTTTNRKQVAESGLELVVKMTNEVRGDCELAQTTTGILESLFKTSEDTCSKVIKLGGLDVITYWCRCTDRVTLKNCAIALSNLALYGGSENQQEMAKHKVPEWLFPLAFVEDDSVRYYALLAIGVLVSNKEIENAVTSSGTLALVLPFIDSHDPAEFAQRDMSHRHGRSPGWLKRLIPVLSSKKEEAQALAAFHFVMEAGIKSEQGRKEVLYSIGAVEPLKWLASTPNRVASKLAAQALKIIGEEIPHKLSQQVPLWTCDDVVHWIAQVGFGSYTEHFQQAQVDGDLLLQITEEELRDSLCMQCAITRKRFLRELRDLKISSDYTSCDPSMLGAWLREVCEDMAQYTYQLLNAGVDRPLLRALSDTHLTHDCRIRNGIHRMKILSKIEELKASFSNASSIACDIIDGASPMSTSSHKQPIDVFISYRRSNGSQLASLLKVHLQLRGFTVFIDIERLRAGKFDEGLLESVKQAKNFIIVLTPNALDRCMGDEEKNDWVHREISAAMEAGINIIPLIDNFRWPTADTLPEDMRNVIYFNAVRWIHDYQDACVDKLETFIRGETNQKQLGTKNPLTPPFNKTSSSSNFESPNSPPYQRVQGGLDKTISSDSVSSS